jgi:hypothetical protein
LVLEFEDELVPKDSSRVAKPLVGSCEVHGQEPWFFGFGVESDMERGEEGIGEA